MLAGGCFWGVQGVFQHVKGVSSAVSGYDGGDEATAHYEMASRGDTGHAESVRITFDPGRSATGACCRSISRSRTIRPSSTGRVPMRGRNIARRSFPPTRNRRASPRPISLSSTRRMSSTRPSSRRSSRAGPSIRAEDYHQDFLARNPTYPYIVVQRPAEDRESEAAVPGCLSRRAGPRPRRAFVIASTNLRSSAGRSA